jgi:hypothetical protein
MSSGYSEEDIRRAAEIREWLIKEISDKQEEVERLRTTLSIIDNLLKQGSFKAAANLGFAAAATTPTPAGPTTSSSSSTTAQIQQQTGQTPAPPPQEQSPAAKRQQQQQQAGAAAPTLRATADNDIRDSGDNNSRNIKPLKRAKDDFLLANAEISQDAVVIVPAPGVNLNANTPPFKSFFLNRILEGMKNKDAEKVSQGALSESDSLNYKVEEEEESGGNSGIIKRIVINKYREKDRLQEIFNTSAWVFTRMLEKSGR